ncbi:MAG: IPTL-CTERM sorting domain-containing protein [Deltaproteobacteria bacterium]|nr:IPTL-CTERM sorting domain-containing protein [Deltaproteobacteria bacterium]MBW1819909.1 IPTL-CTERM sorting domain-containing protein [Deltaproteobacteria bacterium]
MRRLSLSRRSIGSRAASGSAWKCLVVLIACFAMFYALPATAAAMVSNLGESQDKFYEVDILNVETQGFRTDGGTYLLDSVTIDVFEVLNPSGNFTLRIFNDNGGEPGIMVPNGLLAGPGNPSPGLNTYTATGDIPLAPNTTYFVVAQVSSGPGYYNLWFTRSKSETGAWSILDYAVWSDNGGLNWEADIETIMRISVSASPVEIPTLGQWGLILLSLLMAGSACWHIRRKRKIDH